MDASSAQDASPRLVGRYQLVSRVISGALGDLWRAKLASGPEEGRAVLVRLIPRTPAVDVKAVERLTNAGFAAMELRHPKIAAVLDVVVTDSEIAVVTEHVGGAVLQAVARPTGPKRVHATPAVALRVVADLLEAVDAAREPWAELTADPETDEERALAIGIHGGLMPDALLLTTSGETMLLESGLAGVAMTLPVISDHPEVIAYRSPEQIEAKGPIDERSDLFTAGVLAWELVAGRSLFGPMLMPRPPAAGAKAKPSAEAVQTSSVKRKVLSAPVQRLDSLPLLKGKITKELAGWVARCLERDPAARHPTIRDALTELYGLGPKAIAPVADVAKWVADSGATLEGAEATAAAPTPAPSPGKAAAPTRVSSPGTAAAPAPQVVSKVEPAAASPSASTTKRADSLLPDSSDIESVPPSGGPTSAARPGSLESIPPTTDVESISPSSDVESIRPSADVESIAASTRLGGQERLGDLGSIPPSTDVESIPPGSDVESIRPSADGAGMAASGWLEGQGDSDSIPPSTDVESIPPSADVESVPPPSDDDAPTIRPPPGELLGALASARAAFARDAAPMEEEGVPSSTMVSAVPGESAIARLPGFPVHPVSITSAPLDGAVEVSPGAADDDSDGGRLKRGEERRASSRKIVVYVVAAAAGLVVIGLLRALLSGHGADHGAAETASSAATPIPQPGSARPDDLHAAPTTPSPSPNGPSANAAKGLPTSSPTPAGPGSVTDSTGISAAKKPSGPKKRPFRPTGI